MHDETTIANATPYTIWARCDCDRMVATEISGRIATKSEEQHKRMSTYDGSISGGIQLFNNSGYNVSTSQNYINEKEDKNSNSSDEQSSYKWIMLNLAKSEGFTKIVSKIATPFATTGDPIFVTIYIECGDKFELVIIAHPIHRGRNVIVRYDGQIFLQTNRMEGSEARYIVYDGQRSIQNNQTNKLFITEDGGDLLKELDEYITNQQHIDRENPIFSIMGNNGKFICGENGQAPVMCNRDHVQAWEMFTRKKQENGKVALKCMEKYLCSENGERPMMCNRLGVNEWEMFEWIDNNDGTFSLKGNNGKYVSSENGERPMTCNRDQIQDWEKFKEVVL